MRKSLLRREGAFLKAELISCYQWAVCLVMINKVSSWQSRQVINVHCICQTDPIKDVLHQIKPYLTLLRPILLSADISPWVPAAAKMRFHSVPTHTNVLQPWHRALMGTVEKQLNLNYSNPPRSWWVHWGKKEEEEEEEEHLCVKTCKKQDWTVEYKTWQYFIEFTPTVFRLWHP